MDEQGVFDRAVVRFDSGRTSSGMLTYYSAVLSCGHSKSQQNPWKPIEGWKLGDLFVCTECKRLAEQEEWLRNLVEPIQHARFKPDYGNIWALYRQDTTSPTGVQLIGTVTDTPRIRELIDSKRIATLSPTEPR